MSENRSVGVFKYNADQNKFIVTTSNSEGQEITVKEIPIGGGGGASALEELTDVAIVDKTDGQGLFWNEEQQKWINKDVEKITMIPASKDTLGGVIIGDGINVDSDGKISVNGGGASYELPAATAEKLGGIKVGDGLTITSDGTLSVHGSETPITIDKVLDKTSENAIANKPVAEKFEQIDKAIEDIVPYELPKASAETLGGVKIGQGIAIDANGVISVTGGGSVTVDTELDKTSSNPIANKPVAEKFEAVDKILEELTPYTLPIASAEVLGGVMIGDNITISEDGKISAPAPTPEYDLPIASAEMLGGIKIGEGLNITEEGILSANGGSGGGGSFKEVTKAYYDSLSDEEKKNGTVYFINDWTPDIGGDLQPATTETLGGIIVGDNLEITKEGILNAVAAPCDLPIASNEVLGGIKVGQNLTIDENGVLSAEAGGASSATDVTYDDTITQIGVNNVQAAIEYLKAHSGSGGGGSTSSASLEYTNLLEKGLYQSSTTPYELTDKITNYDLIQIVGSYYSSDGIQQFTCAYWSPTDLFTYKSTTSGESTWGFVLNIGGIDRRIIYSFEEGETVDKIILAKTQTMALNSVWGINIKTTHYPIITKSEFETLTVEEINNMGVFGIRTGYNIQYIDGTHYEEIYELIPTLTSNEGENGIASCPLSSPLYNGKNSSTVSYAWHAFTEDNSQYLQYYGENQSGAWCRYDFNSAIRLKSMSAKIGHYNSSNSFNYYLQYLKIGTEDEWVTVGEGIHTGATSVVEHELDNFVTTTAIRFYSTTTKTSGTNIFLYQLQAYGNTRA